MSKYFTEDELRELVFSNSVSEEYGENRRWTRNVETVIEYENKYYLINWEQGLTEMQENFFSEGYYKEVTLKTVTTVSRRDFWVEIDEYVYEHTKNIKEQVESLKKVMKYDKLEYIKTILRDMDLDELEKNILTLKQISTTEKDERMNEVTEEYLEKLNDIKMELRID